MLYLETRDLKIAQITKILLRYDVEASISNNAIKLKGEVPDELVSELLGSITILNISNFEENAESNNNIFEHPVEHHEILRRNDCKLLSITDEYDLRYIYPKAGEVYMCDFGIPYGHEIGGIRPALVVSSEKLFNAVIVVPFRSKIIKATGKYCIDQTYDTFDELVNPELARCGGGLDFTHVRSVDKKRLRNYFGKIKPEVLYKCEEFLTSLFGFGIQFKTVYESNNWFESLLVPNTNVEFRKQVLSHVDISEVKKICRNRFDANIKVKQLLELFGFDIEDDSVEYLIDVLRYSFKFEEKFDINKTVARLVQSKNDKKKCKKHTKQKICSLLDTVVQKKFNFYECSTDDFISLINDMILN